MANRQRYSFPTSSQLERIAKCPASFWGNVEPLNHPALEKGGNTAADTGTKLHKCIEAGFVLEGRKAFGADCTRYARVWNREMAMDMAFEFDVSDLFQDSLPIIDETFKKTGCQKSSYGWCVPVGYGNQFVVESPLGLDNNMKTISPTQDPYSNPNAILAGRADLICAFENPHLYTIVDWKFGAHPVEHPDQNLQLISLAVMSIANYSATMPRPAFGVSMRLVLSYPTLQEISIWEGDAWDLVVKFRERIVPVIDSKLIHANPATYKRANPGDHCVYCPKNHTCSSNLQSGMFIATHLKEGM